MSVKKVILICGGGNAAHIMIADFGARDDLEVRVFAPYQDEAARITAGGIVHKQSSTVPTRGSVAVASNDAAAVVPGADVIILPVPMFAHAPIMTAIAPHVKDGAVIAAIPGQGNFDIIAANALGEKTSKVTLCGFNQLPYQCRVLDYGKCVDLIGHKKVVKISTLPGSQDKEMAELFTYLLGYVKVVPLGHFANVTLHPANQVIHPCIMYGLFHEYKEGTVLEEKPLFYQNTNAFTADVLTRVSDEVQLIAQAVGEQTGVDLTGTPKLDDMMREMYAESLDDDSSMETIFATNRGYAGLFAPLIEVEGGWYPNFGYRYLTEDIPFGLCNLKGFADLAGVATPTMDMVLLWAQGCMGKEYVTGGSLSGTDAAETMAPQALGLLTMEDLKNHMNA